MSIPEPAAPQPEPQPVEKAKDTITFEEFMRVKLRVGVVRVAESVPKSSKLLRLEVDLGPELGTRQILAGIAKQFAPETLIGKQIVIVANLEPAKLMGMESQGMLLAVGDDAPLALLQPGAEVPIGSTVR